MRTILTVLLAAASGLTALSALAGPPAHAEARPVAAHRPHATRIVVVRPVQADGTAARGWSVRRERGAALCDEAAVSAVDPGIVSCSPSAAYLPACWASAGHTVLCLRDPLARTLVRMRYTGTIAPVSAPAEPTPLAMRLRNGTLCTLRVGGAWGTPPGHPHWLGFDSCDDGGSVYGPARGDGVVRARWGWWVREFGETGGARHRHVRIAYLVGTAR